MHRLLFVSILSASFVTHAEPQRQLADGDSLGVVPFAPGSTWVSRSSVRQLRGVARWQANHPDSLLIVEGHASPEGSWNTNLRISQRRAEAVRSLLVRAGADPNRMVVVAQSENQVDDSNPPRRRVVIRGTGSMVDLAREQRDPEVGEDARAARRSMSQQRDVGVPQAAPPPPTTGATTIVIVPGTSGGSGGTVAAGGAFGSAPGSMGGGSTGPGTITSDAIGTGTTGGGGPAPGVGTTGSGR